MLLRAALAIILLGAVFWLLPLRRAGEDGGHHGALDPFEQAGVVELKEGQKAPALALPTLDGGHRALGDRWRLGVVAAATACWLLSRSPWIAGLPAIFSILTCAT